ncbi:MAG: hypothetical protein RIQ33_2268 [Bacteroidota bacterium]
MTDATEPYLWLVESQTLENNGLLTSRLFLPKPSIKNRCDRTERDTKIIFYKKLQHT